MSLDEAVAQYRRAATASRTTTRRYWEKLATDDEYAASASALDAAVRDVALAVFSMTWREGCEDWAEEEINKHFPPSGAIS